MIGSVRRVGCLGLSANPPHFGHLAAALAVLKSGIVDEVWLVPVFAHAFDKPEFAPWHHRLAMTKMLQEPGISVCDIEGEFARTSFTIDTVKALIKRYPNNEFFWIIGSDIICNQDYLRWHEWDELRHIIKFAVVDRPGYSLDIHDIPESFLHVSDNERPESSTEVRELVHEGASIERFVGDQISKYISDNGLYKAAKEARNG